MLRTGMLKIHFTFSRLAKVPYMLKKIKNRLHIAGFFYIAMI